MSMPFVPAIRRKVLHRVLSMAGQELPALKVAAPWPRIGRRPRTLKGLPPMPVARDSDQEGGEE